MISHQNLTILIPSAGSINSACNYNLACKDPGSLNIGSSLAISEIQKNIETKIILVIKEKKEKIYKFKPFKNIEIVEIGNTKNITDTISKSLKYVNTKWCLINPITTIPSSKKINDSFIEFGLNKLPKENWASVCFDKNKNPIEGHYMERLWCYIFTQNKLINRAIFDVLRTKIERLFNRL